MKRSVYAAILILSLVLPAVMSLCAIEARAKEKKKEPPTFTHIKKIHVHPLIAQMKERLNCLSFCLLSYGFIQDKDSLKTMKEAMKDFDTLFFETYKVTPMSEKEKLKRIKETWGELRELLEESSDMEEMIHSNISSAIEKNILTQRYIEEQMNPKRYSMAKEAEYTQLSAVLYEMDMNLVTMVSRALFYVRTGQPDMKTLSVEARMKMDENMQEYLECACLLGLSKKEKQDMEESAIAAKQASMDVMEDYEYVKEKILKVTDRIRTLETYVDGIVIKPPSAPLPEVNRETEDGKQ